MSGLDPGLLDREILLQTAITTQDPDTGEALQTWSNETIFAEWLPAGTREAYQAQQRLGAYVDGVFRIHDRDPRPTPDGTRIVMDGRTYDCRPYIEIERGDGLDIPVVGRG